MRRNYAIDADRAATVAGHMPDDWFLLCQSKRDGLADLAIHLMRAYPELAGLSVGRSAAAIAYMLSLARWGNTEVGTGHQLIWPTLAEVAAAANCSPRWVQMLLHRLADAGLIVHPGNDVAAARKQFVLRSDPWNIRRPLRSRPTVIRLHLPTPLELFHRLCALPGDARPSADYWALLSRWHGRVKNADRKHWKPPAFEPVGSIVVGPRTDGFGGDELGSETVANWEVDFLVNREPGFLVPGDPTGQTPQWVPYRDISVGEVPARTELVADRSVVRTSSGELPAGTGSTPEGRARAIALYAASRRTDAGTGDQTPTPGTTAPTALPVAAPGAVGHPTDEADSAALNDPGPLYSPPTGGAGAGS